MKMREDIEIFWERAEGLTWDEMQSFLSRSIPATYPESFPFHLPGVEKEEGTSGFSFFDSSGAFTKAMMMETDGRKELEAILQGYLSFKQEAESFFRGRGSRVFQPGVETRLVLFARTFHPEFVQHLRFYGVPVSLISYVLIQGGGKKGILLRRVREGELGVRDRSHPLEGKAYERTEGPFFREMGLDPEERRALERLRSLPPLELKSEGLTQAQGKQEGGENAIF